MDNMFIENQSKYGFDETVEKLEGIIKGANWGLLHTHNLQGILETKGFDVLETKVFEVCRPPYANRMLSNDELRIYSNMLPCRLSVYTKADGNTYISRMNNAMFGEMIGGEAESIIADAFHEVEEFLKEVTE